MKKIDAEQLQDNPFKLIGKDWMLITAEKNGKVNTMTASWGGVGILWGKNVATVYIRKSRYTKEFIDASDHFSLCVLPEAFRDKLAYCGKISGRDEDKVLKCGFTVNHEENVPYFEEARLVLKCRKLYSQELKAECFEKNAAGIIDACYNDNDWHVMYIGEIESILIKD